MTSIVPLARRLASSRWAIGVAAALAVGVGGYYGFWRYHLKRYQVLHEGMAIRSGQPTELGLRELVHSQRVRTIVTFRLDDPRLYEGLWDLGEPNGPLESEFIPSLGVRHMVLPMGDEACWPWVSAWQFEEFFRLFDEPDNLPVAMHCVGGRHRTGTMAALFRMEYDGWPAERAVREMLSFDFDDHIPIQDLNLRTFLPRPRPDAGQWQELLNQFGDLAGPTPPEDYQQFVLRLRRPSRANEVAIRLGAHLDAGGTFALPLAARLVDTPEHPLAAQTARAAARMLEQDSASAMDWAIAAALVADLGTHKQQRLLLELLSSESKTEGPPSPRYQALVAGVTNRYTENRIAYLRPLLDDLRQRPERDAAEYRYCDTAVARLSSILDENLFEQDASWDGARKRALAWFARSAEQAELRTLVMPEHKVSTFTAGSDFDGRRE